MTIAELQDFIVSIDKAIQEKHGVEQSRDHAVLTAMLKIVEESGELSQALLSTFGRQRADKQVFLEEEIAHEMADVIFSTFMLAHKMNVDLEKALQDKITIINARHHVK